MLKNSPPGADQRPKSVFLGGALGVRTIIVGLLAIGTLIAASVSALVLGFEIGYRELPGFDLLRRLDRRVEIMVSSNHPDKLTDSVYETTLLRVVADVGLVEVSANGQSTGQATGLGAEGGGLTSFGPDVLLLPYDGQIRAARSADDIRTTGLQAPDNNRAAYQSLAHDPAYEQYTVIQNSLRYNDILHYQSDDARGLIVSYTEVHTEAEDVCYTNTLAQLEIPQSVSTIAEVTASPDDWNILYRTKPCLPFKERFAALEGIMAGGRLAFQAPSTILMTSGDYHIDGMRSNGAGIAQDPDVEYGKVLAVDVLTGAARTLSSGHRNPQGISVDANGEIYIAEHGAKGGDELNHIEDGANYGWPIESYGITYGSDQLPEAETFGRHLTFKAPVYAWLPAIAPSGLTTIKGFHHAWEGDLLASTLLDQSLHRIRVRDGRVVYNEPIRIGTRIRAVHQHTTGEIVLWSDEGELIFLTAEDIDSDEEQLQNFMTATGLTPAEQNELATAIANCTQCHAMDTAASRGAPSLARAYGANIASTDFDNYSDALDRVGGQWTHANLTAFLSDPQSFAPGTTMPPLPDANPELVENIISYLKHVDAQY